jgi:flagellar protein FliO/FliZ
MMHPMTTLLSALAALAAVLALIVLAGRLARFSRHARLVSGSAPRRLSVTETTALDARRRLHLVTCGERHVLLLTGGAQDLVVGWLDPAGRPGAGGA